MSVIEKREVMPEKSGAGAEGLSPAAAAAHYFQARPGFHRLLSGLRQRYESLGRFGGSVVLRKLDSEEQETLSGFFGKSYFGKRTAEISVTSFEKARAETRYGDCGLKELLEAYFGEELVWKQERLEDGRARRKEFFGSICKSFEGTPAGAWMYAVCETHTPPWPLLRTAYAASPGTLKQNLTATLRALNALPSGLGARKKRDGRVVRIGAFAAEISGDPHFFDEGSAPYRLLVAGIAAIAGGSENMGGSTRESVGLLLFSVGLMKDDVSNSVTTFGLTGATAEGPHAGLAGFFSLREPAVLTMMNLGRLTDARAVDDRVFVLENPTVFAELAARGADGKQPSVSLVCSCGQPTLAVLVLLDRLAGAGTEIFYSGDFDPEGLLIAEKLKKRYGKRLILWHFSEKDYEASRSEKPVSEVRLKQLEQLTDPQLVAVAERLRSTGLAGYQERLIDKMEAELFQYKKVGHR